MVQEIELDYTNPFVGIFNRFFQTSRKLKPVIKKRQPISYDNVKECKIFVHIIKGENVPVRAEYVREYRAGEKNE